MHLLGFLLLMPTFISIMATPIVSNNIQNTGKFVYTHKNGTIEEINLFKTGFFHQYDIAAYDIGKFFLAFSFANMIVILFISRILYADKKRTDDGGSGSESGSGSGSDECRCSEEEEIIYESQYFDELEEMPEKELSPEELKDIGCHQLNEETPKGVVYMFYNPTTETFEYYTDKFSDMSYEILDTVARLFTITFKCKQICVNYRKEMEQGENRMLTEIEYDNMMKEKEKIEGKDKDKDKDKEKERSVFAKFKTYNKKNGNNVSKKYYIITEKANKFKYKGKLSDYEKLMKKESLDESSVKQISYADFKKLQEAIKLKEE